LLGASLDIALEISLLSFPVLLFVSGNSTLTTAHSGERKLTYVG
jgi:hypothetical protein